MRIGVSDVARSLAAFATFGLVTMGAPTCLGSAAKHETHVATAPQALPKATDFALADSDGVKRRLSDFRGRPVALYFFCGCAWCHRTALIWGQMQHSGALPQGDATHKAPVTLVVYAGDSAGARQFANDTGLDTASTVLLPDESMHVTLDLYDAEPCPRVFVIDATGHIVYTNNHKDDLPRVAPEIVIASKALTALRNTFTAPAPTRKA